MTSPLPFQNTYARLPERFFAPVRPTPVAAPTLLVLNRELSLELEFDPDWLASDAGVATLAGKQIPEGAEPIAMAYAGHQFGNFVPQLGDGRAILLGEVLDRNGIRRDIQLKGAGRTPFSRNGDGRAALGPVLREYVLSEAMAQLGIPTTRALAAVATGETVSRETHLPGAVLTRVALSHIRIGTFQLFACRGDKDGLRLLAEYIIARHYPEVAHADRPFRALLEGIVSRQAELVAKWLLVGFIHGVMNTDNVSVAGETIDYGPCAFMDEYHPGTVFSSIDQQGRYAYGNQARIAQWNLARLAEAMLPLLGESNEETVAEAEKAVGEFGAKVDTAYHAGMRKKLGLLTARDEDPALVAALLTAMAENNADFTLTFRRLSDAVLDPAGDSAVRPLFAHPSAYDGWVARWRARIAEDVGGDSERQAMMRSVNPTYIPRNHRVEAVINAATEQGDFGPFVEIMEVLSHPYKDQPRFARYADPPRPEERVMQTFCGT